MKTPDEIKKGLQHCSEDGCKGCNYEEDCNMADGFGVLAYDALAYINDLEAAHRTEYCEQADYDCIGLGKARERIANLEGQLKEYNVLLGIAYGKVEELSGMLDGAENCTNCVYGNGTIAGTDYCYDCRWFNGENNRLKWVGAPEAPKEG